MTAIRVTQALSLVAAGMLLAGAAFWVNPQQGEPSYPTAGLYGCFAVFALVLPLEMQNEKRRVG